MPKKDLTKKVEEGTDKFVEHIGKDVLREEWDDKTWEGELKEFEMIMPDGFYKDCKFYHEAVKGFLKEQIESARREEREEVCSLIMGIFDSEETKKDFIQSEKEIRREVIEEIESKLPELQTGKKGDMLPDNLYKCGFNTCFYKIKQILKNL